MDPRRSPPSHQICRPARRIKIRPAIEHRWGLRHQIDRPASLWTTAGVASRGDVISVSISGAFIATPVPLPLLARIRIRFTPLPGKANLKASIEALVATRSGVAVEWCEFAPGPVRALIREERAKSIAADNQTQPRRLSQQRPPRLAHSPAERRAQPSRDVTAR